MKKNNKGFTLIELLVTMSIFAILMLVALPAIDVITNQINLRRERTYAVALESASKIWIDSYAIDCFGHTGTSCTVSYSDLTSKNLIDLNKDLTRVFKKDVSCDSSSVDVTRKFQGNASDGNYHYEYTTHIKCNFTSGGELYNGNY